MGVCGKLAAFTVDKGNRYFKTVGGVLYNKSGTTLYAYPAGRKGKRYVLPETVKRIKSGAFAGSRRLQEIKMNRRAVSVGAEAFSGGSLKKVTLSPRLKRISERAFFGCKKLTEITLPNSVEKIEESAFQGCGSLRRVTIGRRVKRIRRFVFSDCASLRSLVFRGKRMTFGYPDAWVQGNVVFQRAGSRNYKGLRVKLPKSKKGERKKWKKLLWQYGLDRRAKIVFAK